MTQRIVHDCDGCGLREVAPVGVGAITATDPTLVRSHFDLCRQCAEQVIREFLEELSLPERDAWFRRQGGKFRPQKFPNQLS